jgi:hypothetical protein
MYALQDERYPSFYHWLKANVSSLSLTVNFDLT